MKTIYGVILCALVAGMNTAFADRVNTKGEMCARGLSYDAVMSQTFLSDAEKAKLNKGEQVEKFYEKGGFVMGYVFSTASYDAELVMGVFSAADEHAGKNGLGSFIRKSEYRGSGNANPFRVFYEQFVDSRFYSNGRYTVENSVSSFATTHGKGYMLNTRLVESTGADFSPKWLDAYMQVEPLAKGTFVVACNYIVPRDGSGWPKQGMFNDETRKRLRASGHNLVKWIKRVSQSTDKANAYRARLETLLNAARR